jgi:hypothetical protein
MDALILVYLFLALLVWYFWIRKALRLFYVWKSMRSIRNFKTLNQQKLSSISVNFKYFPVRIAGDMPEFEDIMTINELGQCTVTGSILQMDKVEMSSWTERKSDSGNLSIEIQIAGKYFVIQPGSLRRVDTFLSKFLPHLKNRKYPVD